MKILHWTIIFIAIVLPMSIAARITTNARFAALKDEIRLNNAIDTATKDAIDQIIAVSGYEYDDEFGDVINITPSLAQETINTFFHTLAINFNIPYKISDTTGLNQASEDSYIKNYFSTYVPAIVVVAYDGFYVYSQEQNPTTHTYGYELSTKIPFAYQGNGYTVGYTLGNDIYLYVKDKCYKGRVLHNSYQEVVAAYNALIADYTVSNGAGKTPDLDEILMFSRDDIQVLMYHMQLKDRSIKFGTEIFPAPTDNEFLKDYETTDKITYTVGKFHGNRRKTIIDTISDCLREEINLEHNKFKSIEGVTYNFYLPEITQADWTNTINDISVMAFVQGIPVGTSDGTFFNEFALGGSQIVRRDYIYANEVKSDYTGNMVKLYHQHTCPLVTNEAGELDEAKFKHIFITQDGAIAEGYHACQLCN